MNGYIRWPSFSASEPAQFIPIAENNGLMGHLGRWLFEQAMKDHAQLLAGFRSKRFSCRQSCATAQVLPQLSVNFSPIQFRDHKLIDFIEAILVKYQIPAETVTIEITESLLISNSIEIGAQLGALKALGFNIALDDFGTGYSSLSNLHKFPIDIVKIDGSFLSDIDRFETQQIVKAMINLGHELNKKVILEGVEHRWQYDFCKTEGVEYLQGWIISKALPLALLEQFITNQDSAWPTRGLTNSIS